MDGNEEPVAFISKGLSTSQLKWSTFEKKAYAISYSFKKLEHLIRDIHFTLKTDHKNLLYLNEEASAKVQRWKLAIQEYDFTAEHIEGTSNIVADAFSRIGNIGEAAVTQEVLCLLDDFRISDKHYRLISKVHNSMVGHHGIDKTMNKLKLQGHEWLYMREHARRFIKLCPCCEKMSYLKIPIQTHPFTTASYDVMERVNVDTIGPLPPDEWGNTYIIVFIDCFSRFLQLYAVKDTTAKLAAHSLLQFAGRYGCPSQLLSDNGKQFVNDIIEEFNTLVDTEHVRILAYSKQENSIVERANKEVMRHLRAIIFHNIVITNWSISLPIVQRIMNAETKESLGVSPAQILFGNAINLDRGIFLPNMNKLNNNKKLSEWTATMLRAQANLIEVARETQMKKDNEHMTTQSEEVTNFPTNSYVLVAYTSGPPSKLHTEWKEPMRVVNCVGAKYALHNLVTNEIEDIHVSRLKPFFLDPDHVDPRLVANVDAQCVDVDYVVAHRHKGNKRKKSEYEFLVRWRGHGEEHDQWLPWKELRRNVATHQYLKNNHMSSLIPKDCLI